MTEPTPLDREQLQPIVTAVHLRETAALLGLRVLLPPLAPCPTCGSQPTELVVNSDHPAHFLEDRVAFGFRPCGHTFTADSEDLHKAYNAARRETP
ncbi:hypothetical protein [Streptomyces sp. NPDC002088]|uniref:hypothetical protein n=1 Tax=Streptomyces sp. NPDC002088 TaxID=3154665 RepID=UPI00331E3E9C